MKVPITCIEPNPYDEGVFDLDHVAALMTSIKERGGLEKIVLTGRPHPTLIGSYQIEDGKHRVKAISDLFGAKAYVELTLCPLSDAQMLQSLVTLNGVRRKMPKEELKLACEKARDFLRSHEQSCKCPKANAEFGGGSEDYNHELGGAVCVARFLGLDHRRVSELLGNPKPRSKTNSGEPEPPLPVPTQEPTPTDLGGMLNAGTQVPKPQLPEPTKMGTAAALLKQMVEEDEKDKTKTTPSLPGTNPPPNGKTSGARLEAGKRGEEQLRVSLQKTLSNYTAPNGDLTQYEFIRAVERWLQSLRAN